MAADLYQGGRPTAGAGYRAVGASRRSSTRSRALASEAQERISHNVKLPTGYRIEWAGEFEWLQQAKKRLAIILPITFLLIMMLLYGLFNSIRDSLLAVLGLPTRSTTPMCSKTPRRTATFIPGSMVASVSLVSIRKVNIDTLLSSE